MNSLFGCCHNEKHSLVGTGCLCSDGLAEDPQEEDIDGEQTEKTFQISEFRKKDRRQNTEIWPAPTTPSHVTANSQPVIITTEN